MESDDVIKIDVFDKDIKNIFNKIITEEGCVDNLLNQVPTEDLNIFLVEPTNFCTDTVDGFIDLHIIKFPQVVWKLFKTYGSEEPNEILTWKTTLSWIFSKIKNQENYCSTLACVQAIILTIMDFLQEKSVLITSKKSTESQDSQASSHIMEKIPQAQPRLTNIYTGYTFVPVIQEDGASAVTGTAGEENLDSFSLQSEDYLQDSGSKICA